MAHRLSSSVLIHYTQQFLSSIYLIRHPCIHYNCSLRSSCLPARSNGIMPRDGGDVSLHVTRVVNPSMVSRAEVLAEWYINTYLRLRQYSQKAKKLIPLQRTVNQGKSRHWTSSSQTVAKCCDQNLHPSGWVLEGTLSLQLSLQLSLHATDAGSGADSGDGGSNANSRAE